MTTIYKCQIKNDKTNTWISLPAEFADKNLAIKALDTLALINNLNQNEYRLIEIKNDAKMTVIGQRLIAKSLNE